MTLMQVPLGDTTITADKLGNHFAIHPGVMVDKDTKELTFNAGCWMVRHLPSDKQLFVLHQDDPIEYPGEPRALNIDKARAFIEWFETRIDCSVEEPDFTTLAFEDTRILHNFQGDPNYWTPPKPEGTPEPALAAAPDNWGSIYA